MKNLMFVFMCMLTLAIFTSCDKTNEVLTDDLLIEEIATSQNREVIDPNELPPTIVAFTADHYFDTYIEQSVEVEDLGFEVRLANEQNAYFNADGENLVGRRGRRGGHCGNKDSLTMVEIADLPVAITEYVTTNYPDAEIRKAKLKDDFYIIGLTDHILLKFDLEGNFVEELDCTSKPSCNDRPGEQVAIEDLPTAITDYITENYASAELKKARLFEDKYVVKLLIDGDRLVVAFDLDGNFLFERS